MSRVIKHKKKTWIAFVAAILSLLVWTAPNLVLAGSIAEVATEDSDTENYNPETANEESVQQKRVLYISSYSFSWGSVPFQMDGLAEGLTNDYIINYEFMDTKNTVYSDGYKEFYDLLKYKLQTREDYDAVVACDDAALNFVELYKDELFPDIPIVFEGIDNVSNGVEAAKDPLVTGVVEVVDYAANMELAHELMPEAKRLVLILDDMENGIGIAEQLKSSSEVFKDYEVEYLNSSQYSKEGLSDRLEKLDNNDIVFCISMGQSKGGRVYSEEERYAIIRDHVHVPMFRFTQSGVGEGLLGGYIVDHETSTKIAGEMLRQIMENGICPDVEMNTPAEYYFDYSIMDKYGIRIHDLPQEVQDNCVLINEPENFLKRNAVLIILILTIALLAVLVVNYFNLRKQEKMKTELLQRVNVASTAKTDFLSRMSHDLRTPLNGIIGSSELAKDRVAKDSELQEYLTDISDSGNYMLGLINDILDVAKIESGKMQLNNGAVRAEELFSEVKMMFGPLCREKNIHFKIENHTTGIYLMADKQRCQQIVYNLLSNAIKYTGEYGEILFKVNMSVRQGKAGLFIRVEDNGIGMTEEFQKHMYESFSQEHHTATDDRTGSGLGLAIVKRMIDLMGGTIECESEPDEGTRYLITLWFDVCNGRKDTEQEENVCDEEKIKGKTILLCEDNELNAKIAEKILEKVGYNVEYAPNGQEGLNKFVNSEAGHFDAILMDIRMPVMDGLKAAESIRKSTHPDAEIVPIIAMTANAYDDDIQASKSAGMNAHLTKPIDQKKLYKTLYQFVVKETDKGH